MGAGLGETNPDDLFCFEDSAVGIATVEDRHWDQVIVPVVVEVHDRPATPAELHVPGGPSPWDHIIEAGIDLDSGRLGITTAEIPNPAITISVAPGYYRLRAYYGAQDKLRGDLVEARPDDGRHHHHIKLWPHEGSLAPRVLRRGGGRTRPPRPGRCLRGPTPRSGLAPERTRRTGPLELRPSRGPGCDSTCRLDPFSGPVPESLCA